MKNIILLLFAILLSLTSNAQQTVVSGKVTDAKTNEPIPFAGVFFTGTQIGVVSNFEGMYAIKAEEPVDSITVRIMGYKTKIKPIKYGQVQTLNIQLQIGTYNMQEIVVKAGENPAHRIVKAAMKRKKDFNFSKTERYECKSYVKTDVSFTNITSKFTNRRIMKPFRHILDSLQIAAGEEGSMILPILMTETMSDVYFIKNPKRKKEVIHAQKVTGVGIDQGDFVSNFIGTAFQDYNFYNNWVEIMDKNFISPISGSGLAYYKYYLTDSLFLDGKYCYEILIKPKREKDLAFWGRMWIQDTTFALKRISVEIDKRANINFVEKIKIQQDFDTISKGIWAPIKTRSVFDVQNFSDSSFGLLARFYAANSNFVLDKKRPLDFYRHNQVFNIDANDRDEAFWDSNRTEKLTSTEKDIYRAIDTIRNFPTIKTYLDVIDIIINGYYEVGKFELGPYLLFLGLNQIEGVRFRLGARTGRNFSKKWIFTNYLAYGIKDKKFKYSIMGEYVLSRQNWTVFGAQVKDDIEGVGVLDDFYSKDNLFTFASSAGLLDKMNHIRLFRLWAETDIKKGLHEKVVFTNKHFNPIGNYIFEYFTDKEKTKRESEVYMSKFSFVTRWAPGEIYFMQNNRRTGVKSYSLPLLQSRYSVGIAKMLGSSFYDFHKLSLSLAHRIKFFGLGRLFYKLEAARVFSKAPYPLLFVLPGNESIFASQGVYNTMKFFEFIADETYSLKLEYRFEGLVLNKIPLLKKLDWRLMASSRVLFGSFKDYNYFYDPIENPEGILPKTTVGGTPLTKFNILDINTPFVEVSYGIENIFRFARIEVFHRLSYLEKISQPWSIKVSAYFNF